MPRRKHAIPGHLVSAIEDLSAKFPRVPVARIIEAVFEDAHTQAKVDPACEKVLAARCKKAGVPIPAREGTWRAERLHR